MPIQWRCRREDNTCPPRILEIPTLVIECADWLQFPCCYWLTVFPHFLWCPQFCKKQYCERHNEYGRNGQIYLPICLIKCKHTTRLKRLFGSNSSSVFNFLALSFNITSNQYLLIFWNLMAWHLAISGRKQKKRKKGKSNSRHAWNIEPKQINLIVVYTDLVNSTAITISQDYLCEQPIFTETAIHLSTCGQNKKWTEKM